MTMKPDVPHHHRHHRHHRQMIHLIPLRFLVYLIWVKSVLDVRKQKDRLVIYRNNLTPVKRPDIITVLPGSLSERFT